MERHPRFRWKYNNARKRWVCDIEKVRLVIYTMREDQEDRYRLSLFTHQDDNIEDGYMNYISDFEKLSSAKMVGRLMIYG
jgi:hypothetical protein